METSSTVPEAVIRETLVEYLFTFDNDALDRLILTIRESDLYYPIERRAILETMECLKEGLLEFSVVTGNHIVLNRKKRDISGRPEFTKIIRTQILKRLGYPLKNLPPIFRSFCEIISLMDLSLFIRDQLTLSGKFSFLSGSRPISKAYLRSLSSAISESRLQFPDHHQLIKCHLLSYVSKHLILSGNTAKSFLKKFGNIIRDNRITNDYWRLIDIQFHLCKARSGILQSESEKLETKEFLISHAVWFSERPGFREETVPDEIYEILKHLCDSYRGAMTQRTYCYELYNLLEISSNILYRRSINKLNLVALFVHVNLGIILHSSYRSREGVEHLKIAIDILSRVAKTSQTVKLYSGFYLKYLRSIILEIEGSSRDAISMVSKVVSDIEIVLDLPLYKLYSRRSIGPIPLDPTVYRDLLSGRRWPKDYFEYRELLKSLLPNNLLYRKHLEDFKSRLESYLEMTESGDFKPFKESSTRYGLVNLAEVQNLGPKFSQNFMHLSMFKKYEYNPEDTDNFWKFLDLKNFSTKTPDVGPEFLALMSAKLSNWAVASSDHKNTTRLLVTSLFLLEKHLHSLSYSIPLSLFEVIRLVRSSLRQLTKVDKHFCSSFILHLDQIFYKLENICFRTTDKDDRSWLEEQINTAYIQLSRGSFGIGIRMGRKSTGNSFLKLAILFSDRKTLRWLKASIGDLTIRDIAGEEVPNDVWQEFQSIEEQLRNISASLDRRSPLDIPVSESDPQESVKTHKRFGIKNSSNNSDRDPECFYQKLHKKYNNLMISLRSENPSLDFSFSKYRFVSFKRCFVGSRSTVQLHLRRIKGQILMFATHDRNEEALQILPTEAAMLNQYFAALLNSNNATLSPEIEERILRSQMITFLSGFLAKSSRDGASSIKFYIDPRVNGIPFPLVFDAVFKGPVTYSHSISISKLNIGPSGNKKRRVVVLRPNSTLPFSQFEALATWSHASEKIVHSPTLFNLASLLSDINGCTVFHYCGHLFSDQASRLSSFLCGPRSTRITMDWVLKNVRFQNRPLVILNSCRSGDILTNSEGYPLSSEGTRKRAFGENLAQDPISFATAFLACGASSVLATLWDVEDLVATLVGWKFSRLCEIDKTQVPVAQQLNETIRWLRAISDTSTVHALFEEISKAHNLEFRTEFERILEGKLKHFPTDFPFNHPKHWAAFVIYQ